MITKTLKKSQILSKNSNEGINCKNINCHVLNLMRQVMNNLSYRKISSTLVNIAVFVEHIGN